MAGTMRRKHRRRGMRALAVLGALTLLVTGTRAHAADDATGRIESIELKTEGPSTKVVIMLSRPLAFDVHVLDGDAAKKSARRLVLDFAHTTLAPEASKPIDVANDLVRQIRPGQFKAETARIVLDLASDATHSVDAFESPPHVTVALASKSTAGTSPLGVLDAKPSLGMLPAGSADAAKPTADTHSAAASDPPKPTAGALSAATTEASKPAARTIPIRARGRRPYSLLYAR